MALNKTLTPQQKSSSSKAEDFAGPDRSGTPRSQDHKVANVPTPKVKNRTAEQERQYSEKKAQDPNIR